MTSFFLPRGGLYGCAFFVEFSPVCFVPPEAGREIDELLCAEWLRYCFSNTRRVGDAGNVEGMVVMVVCLVQSAVCDAVDSHRRVQFVLFSTSIKHKSRLLSAVGACHCYSPSRVPCPS